MFEFNISIAYTPGKCKGFAKNVKTKTDRAAILSLF